ncbi:hypothetical protein GOP47_0020106 [Adiantum capillus-veneris]|uniref:Uncharacterized protein n=1 Tax=Adiantum capillus-veneris TaxID=13818 RepID=A0A9D4ZAA3_ADICA|nr:hypothetical protein GOP47_0020106 [Adiantum capillus-veneris]
MFAMNPAVSSHILLTIAEWRGVGASKGLLLHFGRLLQMKAFESAAGNNRVRELLGSRIQQGGWQEATIGFAQNGQFVSCSFPVYGSQGTAEIKLKAVRTQGNGMWNYLFKSGHWELISVEADAWQLAGGKDTTQRIKLLSFLETPRLGLGEVAQSCL